MQRQWGKGYIVSIFFREPKSDRFCGEIEKKRIDILSSENWESDIKETNEYVDLYLTEEYSNTDNLGVDLFNIANEIDYKYVELSFRSSRIRIRIYKRDDWSASLSLCLEKITKIYNKKGEN